MPRSKARKPLRMIVSASGLSSGFSPYIRFINLGIVIVVNWRHRAWCKLVKLCDDPQGNKVTSIEFFRNPLTLSLARDFPFTMLYRQRLVAQSLPLTSEELNWAQAEIDKG